MNTISSSSPSMRTSTSATISPTAASELTSPDTTALPGDNAAGPNMRPAWVRRLASQAHQTIDKAQQRLSSSARASGEARYSEKARQYVEPVRERARQYVEPVRERINAQPLKAAGAALATGLVFDKLFLRKPEARVIEEPMYVPETTATPRAGNRRAQGWLRAASDGIHRLGDVGQQALGAVGAATLKSVDSAKAMSATVSSKARKAMPRDLSRARRQMVDTPLAYAEMARSSVKAHPFVGAGVALGLGAVATTLLMPQRRQEQPLVPQGGTSYKAVDKDGRVVGPEYDAMAERRSAESALSSRVIVSAGIALGVGVLLGALLARR
ncbi:MAG TPA: hypothetical protein VLJ86_18200 [Ramlibacter sp.]|nr:hypothetical protein [Ramlibacter sp.]